MKKNFLHPVTGLLVLALMAMLHWFFPHPSKGGPSSGEQKQTAVDLSPGLKSSEGISDGKTTGGKSILPSLPNRAMTSTEITTFLTQVLETLRSGDAEAIRQALAQLDEVLAGKFHDPQAGIAAILAFLESGQDAVTGEGFVVGEGGILTEATTMRVFLLDQLGSLSREAGSPAALESARGNLARATSADEWAVSMRNVAWFDAGSRDFLAERVAAMLQNEAWRQAPTQGMLEAFDFIVHTGALGTVSELNRLIAVEDSPLSRAAGVALDRLATTHALGLTTLLNQNPELFSNTPLHRADLFAHVDLSQAAQLQQAEAYLLRPDVSAAERSVCQP